MIDFVSAIPEDIPAILEMMEEFYAHENIEFIVEKSRATLMDFILKPQFGQIWIIRSGNEKAGYCCLIYSYTLEYHGPDCFLDEIFIKPAYQHQGIGTQTISFLTQFAAQKGIKAMHLLVFDDNKNAYDFYLRNGFVKRKGSLMVKML